MECGRKGTEAEYWGESARTGFKRGREHLDGLADENEKAPLWRHSVVFHQGEKNPEWYKMKKEWKLSIVRVRSSSIVRESGMGASSQKL